MHCKQVGREKLPFSKLGRSPEKFENHCSRGMQPYVQWNLFHACQKLRRIFHIDKIKASIHSTHLLWNKWTLNLEYCFS
ncbi:hypothetical protein T06_9784 [Trichinella sp. T6]|nr:hypothetical protein T06_9784 [Trichinella sp. T6]